MNLAIATCLIATALLAGCAAAPTASVTPPARTLGGVLVNDKGLTLYTYDQDLPGSGRSACNGDCAVKWPPFLVAGNASAAANGFSIVRRDDGKPQWAYLGLPLYAWPEDEEPGDVFGDNYNKVWHAIRNGEVHLADRTAGSPASEGY